MAETSANQTSPVHERIFQDYYGIPWSAATSLIGIIPAGLGFGPAVFNPFAWVLGALAGLSIGYTIRSAITISYVKLGFIILFFNIPIFESEPKLSAFSFLWKDIISSSITTAIVSFLISTNLSILITAYKHSNLFDGIYIPKPFRAHIIKLFDQTHIYRKDQRYTLTFDEPKNESVKVSIELTYWLVNEGTKSAIESITYAGKPGGFEIDTYIIGNEDKTNEARANAGSSRVSLDTLVEPGKEKLVRIGASELFPVDGNDFFTCYTPSYGYELIVKGNDRLEIWSFCCAPDDIPPKMLDENTRSFKTISPVLPFHGIRLYWKPR